ncbi:MAG TPA: hypothetical protein ENN68_07370 [Methanomicrobia archaeon]|nr:hypothetical protein [Methanomicrobia archaeon]
MPEDELLFPEPEALIRAFAEDTNRRRRTPVVKRMPMLLAEESEPLQTILICREPDERILILKDFATAKRR